MRPLQSTISSASSSNQQAKTPVRRKSSVLSLFLCLQFIISINCSESEFNYEELGPDYWKVKYPACKGKSQSPINVNANGAIYRSQLGQIKFTNYNNNINWNVKNNGYTVVGNKADSNPVPSISMSYLNGSVYKKDQFNLVQFHFHWGFNNYQGSEHFLNDNKFPLELHLVHKSSSGKLAVLGILFQLSPLNNKSINPILTAVGLNPVQYDSSSTTFSLESLLKNTNLLSSNGYYRYSGSLTTPPCTEGVIWTVFNSKIPISSAQLGAFRKNDIPVNFRDVQPLNKRVVYTNIKKKNFKKKKENIFIF